jgi:hypothetical protein
MAVTSCSSKTASSFKGTYKLRKKTTGGGSKLISAGLFLSLFFDPEDEGNMFLQYEDTSYTVLFRKMVWNTGLSMNYTAYNP